MENSQNTGNVLEEQIIILRNLVKEWLLFFPAVSPAIQTIRRSGRGVFSQAWKKQSTNVLIFLSW